MLTMKPSELITFLVQAFQARMPVCVTGAPGIGKSDLVDHARQQISADLILSHPAVADPTDAKGLPWVVDGHATFLPFGELDRALHATRPTVWFLDDLGQASPAVQASFMQLLLARRVNGHILSDHVTFVAATNRRTDRAGVTGILEPVKSRFGSIVELAPDLDEWCTWAINANVPVELIAYLRFAPQHLCNFQATADLTNSPVPRTWAHVGKILAMHMPHGVQHAAIAGAVGEGAAVEFSAFLRMYQELPNVDQILVDPTSVAVPSKPAVLYALSTALASKVTDKNFDKIATYGQRMLDAGRGEFAVLLIRDAITREKTVTQTPAFVKLATGELGDLISGK
jgi:hypothetical protein